MTPTACFCAPSSDVSPLEPLPVIPQSPDAGAVQHSGDFGPVVSSRGKRVVPSSFDSVERARPVQPQVTGPVSQTTNEATAAFRPQMAVRLCGDSDFETTFHSDSDSDSDSDAYTGVALGADLQLGSGLGTESSSEDISSESESGTGSDSGDDPDDNSSQSSCDSSSDSDSSTGSDGNLDAYSRPGSDADSDVSSDSDDGTGERANGNSDSDSSDGSDTYSSSDDEQESKCFHGARRSARARSLAACAVAAANSKPAANTRSLPNAAVTAAATDGNAVYAATHSASNRAPRRGRKPANLASDPLPAWVMKKNSKRVVKKSEAELRKEWVAKIQFNRAARQKHNADPVAR